MVKNNGPVIDEALCRCCRSTKKCRILTAEYTWKGKKEIYAEMVMDCFGILLSHLDEDSKDTGVCISCVIRLRAAFAFVQQVRQSEELFLYSKFEEDEETAESEMDVEPTVKELKRSRDDFSELSSIHDDTYADVCLQDIAETEKDEPTTTEMKKSEINFYEYSSIHDVEETVALEKDIEPTVKELKRSRIDLSELSSILHDTSADECHQDIAEIEKDEPITTELKGSKIAFGELSSIHDVISVDDVEGIECAEPKKDEELKAEVKDDVSNQHSINDVIAEEISNDIEGVKQMQKEEEDETPFDIDDNDQIEYHSDDSLDFFDLYKPLMALRASKRRIEKDAVEKAAKTFKKGVGNDDEKQENADQSVETYSISNFSECCSIASPIRNASCDESSSENVGPCLLNNLSPVCNESLSTNNQTFGDSSFITKKNMTPINFNDSKLSDISNSSSNVNRVDNLHYKYSVDKINKVSDTHNSSNDSDAKFSRKHPKHRRYVRDYCLYCENLVLNFSRHILRNHADEPDVQKILSKHKKSLVRKQLISSLRKKGNFIQNATRVVKPMRKLKRYKSTEYLPCPNCLGFYSKHQLWKHVKSCGGNGKKGKSLQSEAQNLLVRHLKIDEKLKETVFTRMRADKVALVAKSDFLICAFGSEYLKTHREKHSFNVISRRLRELAKLLMVMKKLNDSIGDLLSALKPANYDVIVKATKMMDKYNYKDGYHLSTFATNILSLIKQCCNVAIAFALKKRGPFSKMNTDETEADLKQLMQHIDAYWKNDIPSRSTTDVDTREDNKITIIKLAKDLKILTDYLNKKSEEVAVKIKTETYSVASYTTLLETIYCKLLLLNKRRHSELQKIKLNDYLERDNDESDTKGDFDETLTTSERILLKKLEKVVVKDDGGQEIPVYFSEELQDHIKLLLAFRNRFIADSNHFLFGTPGFDRTINGYNIFYKHVRFSGAKNPKTISCVNFRNQIATLFQIFSMSESDLQELVISMGLNNDVHKPHGLLNDVDIVAKISKLIFLMNEGKTELYIGKSLDEIELDLNEELCKGILGNDQVLGYLDRPTERNRRTLVPWTPEQRTVVINFFKKHIKKRQPPKKHECVELKEKHAELLSNKDWHKIKVFVQNTYTKKN